MLLGRVQLLRVVVNGGDSDEGGMVELVVGGGRRGRRCSAGLPEPEQSQLAAIIHCELLQEGPDIGPEIGPGIGPGIGPDIGPGEVPK